jgi:hypothetical protein
MTREALMMSDPNDNVSFTEVYRQQANRILAADYQEQHPDKVFDDDQTALIFDVVAFVTARRPDALEVAGNLLEAQVRFYDQRIARSHRVSDALGTYTVPFLRACLKDVTGQRWSDAKSDELILAVDTIITGTNKAKKAKLIEAAKRHH